MTISLMMNLMYFGTATRAALGAIKAKTILHQTMVI
jgi:hypothetical protein